MLSERSICGSVIECMGAFPKGTETNCKKSACLLYSQVRALSSMQMLIVRMYMAIDCAEHATQSGSESDRFQNLLICMPQSHALVLCMHIATGT